MIDTEELETMLLEIATGKPPTRVDPEANAMRAKLKLEVAVIRSKGGGIYIPAELPKVGR